METINVPKNIKKVYLVDTENFVPLTFSDASSLYLFFIGHSERISVDKICTDANIHFVKCDVDGKNALDFCIAAYMGMLIPEYPDIQYIICSSDKGYDALIPFFRKFGQTKISRFSKETENNLLSSLGDQYMLDALRYHNLLQEAYTIHKNGEDFQTYLFDKFGTLQAMGLLSDLGNTYNSLKQHQMKQLAKPSTKKKGKNALRKERKQLIYKTFGEECSASIYEHKIVVEAEEAIRKNIPLPQLLINKFGEDKGQKLIDSCGLVWGSF